MKDGAGIDDDTPMRICHSAIDKGYDNILYVLGEAEFNAALFGPSTINDRHGPRVWHSNLIQLSGMNRALDDFSIEGVGEEVEVNLVMLHGYGTRLKFFYKNFEGPSQVKGWKIYALDMLGIGRSSRPPFRTHAKDQAGKITEVEN
jgi:cardiolipin-specific phospholipase